MWLRHVASQLRWHNLPISNGNNANSANEIFDAPDVLASPAKPIVPER